MKCLPIEQIAFYKDIQTDIIQYTFLFISIISGFHLYLYDWAFALMVTLMTIWQLTLCSCITECQGISIIYSSIIGYGFEKTRASRQEFPCWGIKLRLSDLWLLFFIVTNLAAINEIIENHGLTLLAHVLATMIGIVSGFCSKKASREHAGYEVVRNE